MGMHGSILKVAVAGFLALALIYISRGETAAKPQQEQKQDQAQGRSQTQVTGQLTDPQFQQLIQSVEGPDLFRAYCASCHGQDAKGNGPAAPMLKATVPDLTLIAANNSGSFSAMRIRRIIMGEGTIASHGSREMPVWGPVFHQVEQDVDRGNVRVENLVKYLESIQVLKPSQEKPADKLTAENVPSGKQLFKQNCAVCHGNDLKGNGPAPPPFKDVPPDLTMLARTHGGKFPEKYVEDVLRNGVVLPAHGPAEMPTWGSDFRARDQMNSAQVNQRITNLINYIKSLQAK
jgi:cbb3-type cytochrome c oxidase subunit III